MNRRQEAVRPGDLMFSMHKALQRILGRRSTDYFVDVCGALGAGFSGCAVLYPDSSAPDGHIHPATFIASRIRPTLLPAAVPLFAGGLGVMGLFGW